MGTTAEAYSLSALAEKVAILERKLASLELTDNITEDQITEKVVDTIAVQITPLREAVKDLKEEVDGRLLSSDTEERRVKEDPPSRVKIVTHKSDQPNIDDDTLYPLDSDGGDSGKYAFILRKNVYETKYSLDAAPNNSEIDIVNPGLWTLLQEHLDHYPYHIFRAGPVTLYSPYEPLVFQFDDLMAEAWQPTEPGENNQVRLDLKLLLDTISGGSSGDEKLDRYFKMRPSYKKQDSEAALPNGSKKKQIFETIQFDDLWTVFAPGTLVFGKPFQGEDQVFIVKDNRVAWPLRNNEDINGGRKVPWELDAWSYDWRDGSFARSDFILQFEHFEGHLPLTSLPFYPFELHPKYEKVRAKLIERGMKFRQICESKDKSRLFEYKGKAITEKKGFSGMKHDEDTEPDLDSSSSTYHSSSMMQTMGLKLGRTDNHIFPAVKSSDIHSRVMVDYESYFQFGPDIGRNGLLVPGRSGTGCACYDCRNNKGLAERYRTYFDDYRKSKEEVWDDEQYLMCPPRVLGYILQDKQWAQLQVTQLHRLVQDESLNAWNSRLKLADDVDPEKKKTGKKGQDDESTKTLLFDLIRSHTSSTREEEEEQLEVDDIIPGKGKGLIILLYGPPGVGKTSTAETIASATGKPLFSVSVADVGTKAKNVESNLSRIFSLATKWQAILLIDEADVFLESRGRGNVIQSTDKNALVSVFLRVLEYYQGIMFLTTNQIAQFDVAIPSRIHVAIRYESLKPEQMDAIFHGFLDNLNDRGLVVGYEDITEWLEDVVYKEGFDGRQIRNIITTALGLARAENKYRGTGGKLSKHHMKRAFANVSAFKRDFNTQMQRYKDSQENMIK